MTYFYNKSDIYIYRVKLVYSHKNKMYKTQNVPFHFSEECQQCEKSL